MIDKRDIETIYGLSPLQEGMLFHHLQSPGSGAYVEQARLLLTGALDPEAFARAWNLLIARHEALRALFATKNTAKPLQIILRSRTVEVPFRDLSELPAAEAAQLVAEQARNDRERGFELSRDVLLRLSLFRLAPERYELIWTFHHIVIDGWCQGILQEELGSIYSALVSGRAPALPPAAPYRRYIQWLEKRDRSASLAYWEKSLQGISAPTHVALPRLPGLSAGDHGQGRIEAKLDRATTAGLFARASQLGITPGTLVQCAWAIALSALRGSRDVVFATTVSGRPAELAGADRMVGLFINAVPTRITLEDGETFASLAQRSHRALGEGVPHHHCPLAEIQARTTLGRELVDHILVFENYDSGGAATRVGGLAISQLGIVEKTNYALTLQVYPGEQLGFGLDFDRARVGKDEVTALQKRLERVLKRVASEPELKVSKLREIIKVRLAASFTADPIAPHIESWLRRAGHAVECSLAPYDQVMQQLLEPKSELRASSVRGVVLMRVDDLLRSGPVSRSALELQVDELLRALSAIEQPLWFALFPLTFAYARTAAERVDLEVAQQRLSDGLRALPQVSLIDLSVLEKRYAIASVTDTRADQAGHVPFADAYLAAIGASLARALFASLREPFKVLAVDCDNTLWVGVAAEDGATGVRIGPNERALQELLIRKVQEGYLIALVSKNVPADVWAVFDQHPDMVLKREHIAAAELSWRPKSEALRRLASELELGLKSFVFLDDNPVECSEVMQSCPEVLTVRMPLSGSAALLEHLWAIDSGKITEEDRQRTAMYRAEKSRVEAREALGSLDDYLCRLGLVLHLSPIGDRDLARASQLTQRTNQFNLSTVRRSEAELKELLSRPDAIGWCVRVRDRFGDYGLVGVVLARVSAETLFLDTLLLSCRVLGRGVEDAILVALGQVARGAGAATLTGTLVLTERNAPVVDFVRRIGFVESAALPEGIPLQYPVASISADPRHCELVIAREPVEPPPAVAVATPPGEAKPVVPEAKAQRIEAEVYRDGPERGWMLTEATRRDLGHRFYYAPLAATRGSELLAMLPAPRAARGPRPPYRPLRTIQQLALARMYQEILGAEDVGLDDDFFALGGHSLSTVQLVSRIQRDLGVAVSLGEVFEHPKLHDLAEHLQTAERRALATIPRLPVAEHYALSDAQRRLWAIEHLQGGAGSYIMAGALVLEGPLDVAHLEQALASVVRRHDVLRTAIIDVDGVPRQRVLPFAGFALQRGAVADLAAAEQVAAAAGREPIELSEGQPLRVRLLSIDASPSQHVLILCLHHIAGDGWSYRILLNEVAMHYRALGEGRSLELPELPVQYRDYAAYRLQPSSRDAVDRDYWHRLLAAPLPVLELPTDRPRPAIPNFDGDALSLTLAPELCQALVEYGRKHGLSLYMTMLSAVYALLYRYSGQSDLIVGTPQAGRDHPALEGQIGFFVGLLPLRINVDGAAGFQSLSARVQKLVLSAFNHRGYPFDRLVGELPLARDPSRSPLFDVLFVVDEVAPSVELPGLAIRPLGKEAGAGKLDLGIVVTREAEQLTLRIDYRTDLFDRGRIDAMTRHFVELLRSALAEPERAIDALELLPPGQRQSPPEPVTDARILRTLGAAFQEVAERRTTAPALIEGAEVVSYGELLFRATALAGAIQARVEPGSVVGVLLPRSIAAVVAQLAIQLAGAVYLPLDPAYPEKRLRHMIDVSACRLAIAEDAVPQLWVERLSPQSSGPWSKVQRSPGDPAYIIFTSGSTGVPKGISGHSLGLLNTAYAQIVGFQIDEASRVLQFASLGFDASLSEIWTALLAGAVLVIAPPAIIEDPAAFLTYLDAHGVSVATLPPVYLAALQRPPMPSLRTLVTAGESASPDEARHYAKSRLCINAYGPAECSICGTMQVVSAEGEGAIPIGVPLPHTRVFVVDKAMRTLLPGLPGEICIAGAGVANGYLGTQTGGFFEHPLCGRAYRTGDLGRLRIDGALEFLGRADDQVKIAGQRVELEEVRLRLLGHPEVEAAQVVDRPAPTGERILVGFFVGRAEPTALRSYLASVLPPAAVPRGFVRMAAFPMLPNGKIDREALRVHPLMESSAASSDAAEAQLSGAAETLLASVWRETLGVMPGASGHFFELGGDSLRAIRVVSRLRSQAYRLTVRQIFAHPVLREQAALLVKDTAVVVDTARDAEPFALSPVQAWFAERVPASARDHFNLAVSLAGRGLSRERLEQAVQVLVEQHGALRSAWSLDGQQQRYASAALGKPRVFEIRCAGADDGALIDAANALHQDLSLTTGDLVRVLLAHTPTEDRVILIIHHAAVDIASLYQLVDELSHIYGALAAGQPASLPPPSVSFASWVRYLDTRTSAVDREALFAELVAAPRLSHDGPASQQTAVLRHEGSSELCKKLREAGRLLGQLGETSLVLGGLCRALAEQGLAKLAVSVESHGRNGGEGSPDVARTVGWFTALCPLVLQASGAVPSAVEARTVLRKVRAAIAAPPGRELLVAMAKAGCDPEIGFADFGSLDEGETDGDGALTNERLLRPVDGPVGQTRGAKASRLRLLEVDVLRSAGRPVVSLTYDERALDAARLRKLAELLWVETERLVDAVLAEPTLMVFGLPFAGASAQTLQVLSPHLPGRVKFCPLVLPGREAERPGPLLRRISELVAAARAELPNGGVRYALFGHSLGALVSFELARRLSEEGVEGPEHLLVSGLGAPSRIPARKVSAVDLGEAANGDAARLALLQADFEAVETYEYAPGPRLSCPVTVLYGEEEGIAEDDATAWAETTTAKLGVRRFAGGHLFLLDRPDLVAAAIDEALT